MGAFQGTLGFLLNAEAPAGLLTVAPSPPDLRYTGNYVRSQSKCVASRAGTMRVDPRKSLLSSGTWYKLKDGSLGVLPERECLPPR